MLFACPLPSTLLGSSLMPSFAAQPEDDAAGLAQAPDAALARAAAAGNRRSFEALMRRCQGPLFGYCVRLLSDREAAADAAQESFARAWASLASYDARQPFEVWVLRIARNHCYDLLRRAGRLERDDAALGAAEDPSQSAEQRLEEAQMAQRLETALARLPARDREVVALYYVQRRTTAQIGAILGVAPGTVMARLFRARARLRRILEEICR